MPHDYTLPTMRPEDRIRQLLQELAKPPEQKGLGRRLLEGIPQAISVLTSEKPGEALNSQIQGIIQQKMQEKQRQQQIQMLGAQIEIEEIRDRERERRQEEASNRRLDKEAAIRKEEFNAASGKQRAQIRIKNRFDRSLAEFNANENRLGDIRRINANKDLQKMAQQAGLEQAKFTVMANTAIPLIMSGYMDGKTAYGMADRMFEGTLSQADYKAMEGAAKKQRSEYQAFELKKIGEEAKARFLASGKSPAQAAAEFLNEYSTKTPQMWVITPDGKRIMRPMNLNPLTQDPMLAPGEKFDGAASPLEAQSFYAPLFHSLQSFQMPGTFGQVGGAPDTSNIGSAEAAFRQTISGPKPVSFEEAKKRFNDPRILKGFGIDSQQAKSIVDKIEAEIKGKPITQALPATLEETDSELSEIDSELRRLQPVEVAPMGGPVPRGVSVADRGQIRELMDRRKAILTRRSKQAEVQFIQSQIDNKKAELETAKTKIKRERLEKEIAADIKRLEYAQSQVDKP